MIRSRKVTEFWLCEIDPVQRTDLQLGLV